MYSESQRAGLIRTFDKWEGKFSSPRWVMKDDEERGRVVFIRALMLAARRMLAVGDEDSDSAARVLIASMLSEIDDAQDFYKKRLQEA